MLQSVICSMSTRAIQEYCLLNPCTFPYFTTRTIKVAIILIHHSATGLGGHCFFNLLHNVMVASQGKLLIRPMNDRITE